MPRHILIVQADLKSAQTLSQILAKRGDLVWRATKPIEICALLKRNKPVAAFVDLHLPNGGWREALRQIRQQSPETQIIGTSDGRDLETDLRAKEAEAPIFLRQPFSEFEVERTLRRLNEEDVAQSGAAWLTNFPKMRVPVRVKITFPYMILALAFALAGAYIVSRVALDSIQERFINQLIESGKLTADWMVQEENRLLETLRLLANTQGMAKAVIAEDAERVRVLTLPIVVNSKTEAVEVLDLRGTSLLSLRHEQDGDIEDYEASRGEALFGQWGFVRHVLEGRVDRQGDKYVGRARTSWGDYLYVAGPIFDDDGHQVGIILVGKSLPTLVAQIRQDTLVHTTIYDPARQPIVSTLLTLPSPLPLEQASQVTQQQDS